MNAHASRNQSHGPAPARLGWVAVALAGVACVCAGTLSHAWAIDSREFSSEEAEQLRAGKLVVRPEKRSVGGAHLLGGLAWQVIDAPVATVWRVLTDVPSYARFLPSAEEVRLNESTATTRNLFVRHRLGFITASYFVNTTYDPAHGLVRFRMDRTRQSSLKDAWGELRVSAYGTQKSVVSIAIMADLGEGLFVGLVRSNVHEWMLRVPEQLKKFVEARRR